MSWLDAEIILTGETIQILPLSEAHFPALISLAADKRIWQHYVFDGSDAARFTKVLETAIEKKATDTQYPFTVVLRSSSEVVGSTRLMNIHPEHRKIEIGFTWYDPGYWGSIVNIESKLLLLTYCLIDVLLKLAVKTGVRRGVIFKFVCPVRMSGRNWGRPK